MTYFVAIAGLVFVLIFVALSTPRERRPAARADIARARKARQESQ